MRLTKVFLLLENRDRILRAARPSQAIKVLSAVQVDVDPAAAQPRRRPRRIVDEAVGEDNVSRARPQLGEGGGSVAVAQAREPLLKERDNLLSNTALYSLRT